MNQPLWESLWTVRRTTRFVVGSQVSVAIPAVVYSLRVTGRRGGCFRKADSDIGDGSSGLATTVRRQSRFSSRGKKQDRPASPPLPVRALAG